MFEKIENRESVIGIIGLGYVGLPLAKRFVEEGFKVYGFDTDESKIESLINGESYIKHINIASLYLNNNFIPTNYTSIIHDVDIIIICVPTPLNRNREPDMKYVFSTAETISKNIKKGQLIILESTTYPGTTDEDLLNILESSGLIARKDFYLAFSPEREDPNNKKFTTKDIPKIVGGIDKESLQLACKLYSTIIEKVVPVSSTKIAESSKLLENIFRCVNIALVNELKILFDKMGIDIWEVIEASSTKPFGFMPFYPGPGLGGHCIPIDPFYLTWKAREFDLNTKFIELAGEINNKMPNYVVEKSIEALNSVEKCLNGSKIFILGIAYKKDIDDLRESPSLKLIELFKEKGSIISYNDPYIPYIHDCRHYHFNNMQSIEINKENLFSSDLIIIATDHTSYDYKFIFEHSSLIVDTRNSLSEFRDKKIFKA